jgi:anaerobic ribonucleoside-triphosphate reductase
MPEKDCLQCNETGTCQECEETKQVTTPEPEKPKQQRCGEPCEVFSRCCGYIRPWRHANGRDGYNKGKMEEVRERRNFNWKKALEL